LEIREAVLGKGHPDVAKQLNNLALLCQNQVILRFIINNLKNIANDNMIILLILYSILVLKT